MADQVIKNPVIRQGWLRVLLFGCCFFLVTVLIGLLVVLPIVLSFTGSSVEQLKTNLPPLLSGFLAGNYLWLTVILEFGVSFISVWAFRKWIDRRSWMSLGWSFEGWGVEAVTGLFMGPALLGIASVLLVLTGHVQWTDIDWEPSSLFVSLGLMLLIAFSEELVFRGYILGNLMESFSNKWIAVAISAFLFAIFHFSNPGIHTLAFANLFLAGLLLGINYIYTKNLWFSILFHFSWNFFQGPILGFRVSGIIIPSLLQTETKGDLLVTGGDFGLEGSILNTAVSLIAILILAWAFGRKYRSGTVTGA